MSSLSPLRSQAYSLEKSDCILQELSIPDGKRGKATGPAIPACVRPWRPTTAKRTLSRVSRHMSRIVYVNGAYVPEERGEGLHLRSGLSVWRRRLRGDRRARWTARRFRRRIWLASTARLARSRFPAPCRHEGLRELHEDAHRRKPRRRRHRLSGNQPRARRTRLRLSAHASPDRRRLYPIAPARRPPAMPRPGVKVVTIPDIRWKRRDIKSTSMLAQAMGKQEAKRKGAYEAWMVEDGA